MAIPSLKHQIEFVDTIIVMKAILADGDLKYVIEEVLKSSQAVLRPGDPVRADFSIFELMGYHIDAGQNVVALLAIRKNLHDYDCIDFIPVNNNKVVYGKQDAAVREELTLEVLRRLITFSRAARE